MEGNNNNHGSLNLKGTASIIHKVLLKMPQAILLEDSDSNIIVINELFCKLFGIDQPTEDLEGQSFKPYLHIFANHIINYVDFMQRAFELIESNEPVYKERVETLDGKILLRDFIPVNIEGYKWRLWIYHDETEKITAHNSLSTQKQFYESVLNNIPADVGVFSSEFKYLYVNPIGIKDPEIRKWIIGKDDFEYVKMRGKDSSFALKRYDQFLNIVNSKKELEWEEKIEPLDKEPEYHLRKISPIYDDEGNLTYLIGYGINITERKKVEEKIEEARKITEESAKAKELFLANMSHEIRTPMNGIIGIISLLQKTTLTQEQYNYLNIVQYSAQNLISIINDIIDLEKVGTGKIQLEHIAFDIIKSLQQVINLYETNAVIKGLQVIFNNMIGETCFIKGDPTRFNQIINNLLSNAVKFTDAGFITVTALVQEETTESISLKFAIQDSGIGMDTKTQELLFQPFTQAYADTNRKYGGSGLGLSITKNLLELQDGNIWVKSAPGKGSTFYFTITYDKAEAVDVNLEQENNFTKPGNKLKKLRVLLAEDNEINKLLAKNILEYWGFYYKVASNGNEVMDLIKEEDFDLILMDIQMPHKNGLEAAAEIRQLPDKNKKDTPIIALTANALKGEELKYIAAGMNDYLTKPFKEEELYEIIHRVLLKSDYESAHKKSTDINNNNMPHASEKLYDLTLVQELASNDMEFVKSLAQIYLDTVPVTVADMTKACEAEDWHTTGQLAHKLKSTVDTIQVNAVKEDVRSIEACCKSLTDLDKIPGWVKKVELVLNQVSVQLKDEFSL